MDLLRTERTFISAERARKFLFKQLDEAGISPAEARYLIAVNVEGRFAPVLVGERYIPFAHHGITVVG